MNPEIEERDVFQARLRQMRLARGLSLAALSALMGGAVTKQALSKYEQGRALPTSRVLTALARALEVKSMELLRAPTVAVEVLAFRRGVALRKRAEQQLVNLVTQKLEERVRLHDLAGTPDGADIPVRSLRVAAVEDSERAASALRDRWSLGTEPLASVTDVLEGHCVHRTMALTGSLRWRVCRMVRWRALPWSPGATSPASGRGSTSRTSSATSCSTRRAVSTKRRRRSASPARFSPPPSRFGAMLGRGGRASVPPSSCCSSSAMA